MFSIDIQVLTDDVYIERTLNNNFPENVVEALIKNQEQIFKLMELQNQLIEKLFTKT